MPTNPQKKHLTYTIRDFYKNYRKEARKQNKFPVRDYKKYKDFIFDVFAECFQKIIKDGWHLVLPYSLGEFYLKELVKRSGKKTFDFTYFRRTGKKRYLFNRHTLNRVYKFVWDRKSAKFPTSKYYNFELLRGNEISHRKYKVGREAIANFFFNVGKDSSLSLPNTYNDAIRRLEEPKYDN